MYAFRCRCSSQVSRVQFRSYRWSQLLKSIISSSSGSVAALRKIPFFRNFFRFTLIESFIFLLLNMKPFKHISWPADRINQRYKAINDRKKFCRSSTLVDLSIADESLSPQWQTSHNQTTKIRLQSGNVEFTKLANYKITETTSSSISRIREALENFEKLNFD